ncbi:MAG: type II toxin-antitoxin system HicA family toxin [bacterium]|nr:type II toxin-antitoxin system HicA family toxin [bacterium]
MPKLPILSGRDVVQILTHHFDFRFVTQRGSHIKLRREKDGQTVTTIVPDHKELMRGTLSGVLDLAQVTKEEFIVAFEK